MKDQGRWIKGKVLLHQGSTVTTEANKTVIRVSQSKVRRDHDEWHDAQLPPPLKDEGPQDPRPRTESEKKEE